ncbi:MAG: RNB domain-containing ribonuclease [Spirochaetes bacterium]|nr:RNB domain-containing ribonuclease [Spirochaetota bacterium]
MNDIVHEDHRAALERIARRVMVERGLLPDFSPEALAELAVLEPAPSLTSARDLRGLPWCSIDNDDSRDLDQLTVARKGDDGAVGILVAIADVDALVHPATAIDGHARHNTSSVYTAAKVFSMLPERLSTDLSSLNFGEDRPAIVMDLTLAPDGTLASSEVYRALVRNHARLSYDALAAWLEGNGPEPDGIATVPGLADNLRLQDGAALAMKEGRRARGALDFESRETRPVFSGNSIARMEANRKNRAKEAIENFMVAANGVVARFLEGRGLPTLARVVRTPKRWDRIVAIAAERGVPLPAEPDPKALAAFLDGARQADPERFADLSLSVIKLLGPGEYVAQFPGEESEGHFGLAVKDYAHSTAPNRRYPDLVVHRLIKAALEGRPSPYGRDELAAIGRQCSEREDAVNKVERQVGKSAVALLLESRIGDAFDGLVTGAAEKGTWVRIADPPAEGRIVRGHERIDVGDRVRVRLLAADVERGYLDFERV